MTTDMLILICIEGEFEDDDNELGSESPEITREGALSAKHLKPDADSKQDCQSTLSDNGETTSQHGDGLSPWKDVPTSSTDQDVQAHSAGI